jgi:hypothetical protein
MFGGGVQNANQLLVQLLSTLHDINGKVNVEGVYDDVLELTEFEKEQIKALGFDEEKLKKQLGLTELTEGENNYPYPEKINANIRIKRHMRRISGGRYKNVITPYFIFSIKPNPSNKSTGNSIFILNPAAG